MFLGALFLTCVKAVSCGWEDGEGESEMLARHGVARAGGA